MKPRLPSKPIWFVVVERERALPFASWGVFTILASIPGDFADLDALHARYTLPFQRTDEMRSITALIFSREPENAIRGAAGASDEQR